MMLVGDGAQFGMVEHPLAGLEAVDIVAFPASPELWAGIGEAGDQVEQRRVAQARPDFGPKLCKEALAGHVPIGEEGPHEGISEDHPE